ADTDAASDAPSASATGESQRPFLQNGPQPPLRHSVRHGQRRTPRRLSRLQTGL
ncbi:hypothetical protein LTR60_005904, partial [Cryomyces antarcticus]